MDKKNFKKNVKKVADGAVNATKKVVTTVVDVADEAIKYYEQHKTTFNKLGALLIGSGVYTKFILGNNRNTRDDRDRRFWDARMGRYVYSRRVPTNYEMQEIEARYRNGESYREILMNMGLLE